MTVRIILPTKRRVDIRTETIEFAGEMRPGEVISDAQSFISVFAGIDPNPQNVLFGLPFVDGTEVRQKIRQGIPGVIYELTFEVTLSNDRVIDGQARLAVLQDNIPASGLLQIYYYTTTPYPLEIEDGVVIAVRTVDQNLIEVPIDGINTEFFMISGTLRDILRTYDNWPPEGVDIEFLPLSGTLRDILKSYDMLPEGILVGFTPMSGTLNDVLITYSNYKPEGINTAFLPVSGTLT